jgi:dehydrogenase/reductase SDR family member 7B
VKFKDKVVWITGASMGIGEALAYLMAREGATLILSSRKEDQLNKVKENCALADEKVTVLPLDLADAESLPGICVKALKAYGHVDILVNNGGITQRSLVLETSLEVDRRIMEIDYFGQIAITKHILPSMVERKSGHIATVSSVMGRMSTPMRSAYCAAKHALHGFFDALRAEVYNDNVRVTMICPAGVKTNVSYNAVVGDGSAYGKMDVQQEKGITAEECAEVIARAILKEKEEVLAGNFVKYAVLLNRYLPRLYSKVVRKADVT